MSGRSISLTAHLKIPLPKGKEGEAFRGCRDRFEKPDRITHPSGTLFSSDVAPPRQYEKLS